MVNINNFHEWAFNNGGLLITNPDGTVSNHIRIEWASAINENTVEAEISSVFEQPDPEVDEWYQLDTAAVISIFNAR